MRKNYFIKLIKYIKNVYNIHGQTNKLKDGRVNPSYKTGKVILPVIDTIRDTLKSIDLDGLANIDKHVIKKAIENKTFRNGTIDGFTVAAIDGTKLFGYAIENII